MSNVASHTPGTFCWPELATSDTASARQFYSQLFGWVARDVPTPSGSYFLLQLGGRDAAAMYELSQAMRDQKIPPHWAAYVSVENVDETARLAQVAGGRVLMGPFDVMDLGRMAVIADPQGASFCAWQAGSSIGAGVVSEPGALGWMQLNARDPAAARRFYPAVLGWTFREDALGAGATYTTWLKSDGAAGGMMAMPPGVPAEAPSHWLTYFTVASVDDSHARALSLGAASYVPPTDIAGGMRFSVLGDPQGAMFALLSGM
jgi:uncharacterized protein